MKLKILSYEFEVTFEKGFWDNRNKNNPGELTGLLSMRHNQITIDDDNPRKQETLLHEILHAVAHFWVVDLEEKDVERLSEGLYHVLRENGMLNNFGGKENDKEKD